MKYYANNLADIANWFEEMAQRAATRQIGTKPKEGALLAREAVTWRNAADFIRNCEMKEAS